MRTLWFIACAAVLGLPSSSLRAQSPEPGGVLRGVRFDAALLARGTRPGTAAFGTAADLALPRFPGLLRLGLATWSSRAAGEAERGRDLSLAWLFRSRPHGAVGLRFFAGAGPALATLRAIDEDRPARARPAAAAEAGVALPLGIRDAVSLEAGIAALGVRADQPHLAARLALRLGHGIRAFARGETPRRPALANDAQPEPAPPDLDDVAAVAGGLLVATPDAGGLRLDPSAFDSTGSLTRDAFRRLARAGGALHRLGLGPVHVEIYARDTTLDSRVRASERAVAVARALTRGGYSQDDMRLQVATAAGNAAGGRVLAEVRCSGACAGRSKRQR